MSLNPVLGKQLKIAAYLLSSGLLAYALGYVLKNESLTVIFAPVINFIEYSIVQELRGEGYTSIGK